MRLLAALVMAALASACVAPNRPEAAIAPISGPLATGAHEPLLKGFGTWKRVAGRPGAKPVTYLAGRAKNNTTVAKTPVDVTQAKRMRVAADTRICVTSEVEPRVRQRVQASGEQLENDELTLLTAGLLHPEIRTRYPHSENQDRVVPDNKDPSFRETCSVRNVVHVHQLLTSGTDPRGYRLTLTAVQGRNVFKASIDRPYFVEISAEYRHAAGDEADVVPGTGKPFWDVRRDSIRLTRALITHLLGRAKT